MGRRTKQRRALSSIGRRPRTPRTGRQIPLTAQIAGVAALVVVATAAAIVATGSDAGPGPSSVVDSPAKDGGQVAVTIIYTATTSNDASASIGSPVDTLLRAAGREHQAVEIVRVDGDGQVERQIVDMTPRVDGAREVLRVSKRADEAIDRAIAGIEAELATAASASGRSLLAGLLKLDGLGSRPLVIYSSGLDLADPLDFRTLAFDVPPGDVVELLESTGELPRLNGNDVTFVVVPPAGAQEQMRRAQADYTTTVWTAILLAAGASDVTFVPAAAGPPTSTVDAPTVDIPPPPSTPIVPQQAPDAPGPVTDSSTNSPNATSAAPRSTTCTLDAPAYFRADSVELIDPDATRGALADCVAQVDERTTITVEGHTSYTGRPNNETARELSRQRAEAVVDLLVSVGVRRSQFTLVAGYGNERPVYPDEPASPRNRCVVVTFTNP